MLNFVKPSYNDYEKMKTFLRAEGEMACETNPLTAIMWHEVYDNLIFLDDESLIFKSENEEETVFSLPFGNFERGMALIFDYCRQKDKQPSFFSSYGPRFIAFKERYGDKSEIVPIRDGFDYIYRQSDLAGLAGKKYHSKRNHIAAFSKKHEWSYESINQENIPEVLKFADDWYRLHGEDEDLQMERVALYAILEQPDRFSVKGGLIRTDGKVVAFTLGSPINEQVFDTQYEKADPEYAEAYSVINREFAARELTDYLYINREDDLGLEGLRKAKLSYKPEILLEKYIIHYKGALA